VSPSAERARKAEAEARPEKAEGRSAGGLWEQVSTLLVAVLIALAIRAFVIEPYRIPSGSMLPTLLVGDHLFVNKFIYGIKLPFTDVRLPGIREPKRGDVVVFTVAQRGPQTFPADLRPELPREEFVKRIIGLPGDRISFRGGRVFVNGEPVEPKPLGETFEDDTGTPLDVSEVALGEKHFRILDDPRITIPSPPDTITVEAGRYFLLGDNRDHSKDSRVWGTVRLAEVKGPAFVLYWSWDFNGSWGELLNPVTLFQLLTQKMRWDRIGDGVS
jgi:signal peptidase I